MKTASFLLAVCALVSGATLGTAQTNSPKIEYAIAIHGGAGDVTNTAERRENRIAGVTQALTLGKKMLADGASGLDTVEAVIRLLEDSHHFNAGKGAVLNAAGGHELDASIMDGATHAGGAVGGVRTVKNPISLARKVMTETRHVLLVAAGAESFADEFSEIERVENEYFTTERQKKNLEKAQRHEREKLGEKVDSRGTVGCVVLDRAGNLAAGTSTGGLTNKRFGRIGDTPILSAGTYADNESCAVSCTGTGEDFIRYAVAFDVSARLRYRSQSLDVAVHEILHDDKRRVRGGIIAVDKQGTMTLQFNTKAMVRGLADSAGRFEVLVD